jgi:ABC-2 type transport system ATP-binding protein
MRVHSPLSWIWVLAGIAAIMANGLEYREGRLQVLRGLSLMLFKGEVAALLGYPEAEALLGLLAGVRRPAAGGVRVLDLDPYEERAALSRRLGYLPPDPWLPEWARVRRLAEMVGARGGLRPGEAAERMRNLLARMGMKDRLERKVSELSTEDRALAATLLTLLPDPEVLLLSSPLKMLGPLARSELASLFSEYASRDRALVFSASSIEEADFASRVVLLADGRVAASGPLSELLKTIGAEHYVVLRSLDTQRIVDYIGKMPQVKMFSVSRGGAVRVWLNDFEHDLPVVLDLLVSLGIGLDRVEVGRLAAREALLNYIRRRAGSDRL